MKVNQLFQRNQNHSSYKAVDETNTSLTEEEINEVLRIELRKKIAAINNKNYLKAVSTDPTYTIPTFDELYDTVIDELKNLYGWVIDEFNEPTIKTLCYYFSNDGIFELIEEGYSHKKGLIIIGPVGCGKTTLLKLFKRNNFNPFNFISCRDVASQYAEFGQAAIKNYSRIQDVSKREWFGHEKLGLCFDDLGTESEKKNFGNQLNVMAEIILNRYDGCDLKNKTHFTTNLGSDEIQNFYGLRATSRMREMLNIIQMPFNSPDRRK